MDNRLSVLEQYYKYISERGTLGRNSRQAETTFGQPNNNKSGVQSTPLITPISMASDNEPKSKRKSGNLASYQNLEQSKRSRSNDSLGGSTGTRTPETSASQSCSIVNFQLNREKQTIDLLEKELDGSDEAKEKFLLLVLVKEMIDCSTIGILCATKRVFDEIIFPMQTQKAQKLASFGVDWMKDWEEDELIMLLQVTKLMMDCDSSLIIQTFVQLMKQHREEIYEEMIEAKLQRVTIFRDWKERDKNQLCQDINKKLSEYGEAGIYVDSAIIGTVHHFRQGSAQNNQKLQNIPFKNSNSFAAIQERLKQQKAESTREQDSLKANQEIMEILFKNRMPPAQEKNGVEKEVLSIWKDFVLGKLMGLGVLVKCDPKQTLQNIEQKMKGLKPVDEAMMTKLKGIISDEQGEEKKRRQNELAEEQKAKQVEEKKVKKQIKIFSELGALLMECDFATVVKAALEYFHGEAKLTPEQETVFFWRMRNLDLFVDWEGDKSKVQEIAKSFERGREVEERVMTIAQKHRLLYKMQKKS